jgi:phosphohistidine phosphatase
MTFGRESYQLYSGGREMLAYLVQHAQARSKVDDPERGLSETGFQDIQRVAMFLRGHIDVPVIAHSGKKRARQTAEILADTLDIPEIRQVPDLDPMADPGVWSAHLASMTEDVMLVGHLPHLSRLAGLLLTGDPEREIVRFRNAGVICIEKGEGEWRLSWMLVPSLLVGAGN